MTTNRFILILCLVISLSSAIILEVLFNFYIQSSAKLSLLEHIQFSLSLPKFLSMIFLGSINITLLFGLSILISNHGLEIIYITLLNFFTLIPCLIDLINLCFIYQYKIKYFNDTNSSMVNIENKTTRKTLIRFVITFTIAFIRLLINSNFTRRRFTTRWKQQILILFDLSLFILVTISLMRYSTRNLFRFVRKIILCPLIYQLNNLFFNKDFWPSCVQWNEQLQDHLHLSFSKKIFIFILNRLKIELKSVHLNIIHFIFSIQWLTSLFIIIFYIFQFGINTDDDHLFCMKHIPMFLKAHAFNVFLCTSIFCIIHYDISQNRNILDQYGIEPVCIPTKLISNSKKLCVVCYDEKHFNEFCFSTIKSDCQHLNRTICNSCLFHHVEQACQITFTDDVYCPELGCDVKFDYNTVRAILYFNRDKKLVERYDRFVLHRQLEQMDEFIWCSNKLCNIGQLNEGGILNNIVTCFQCQQKTCFRHRVEWHQGLTCEEYDQFMDFDYECSRRWIVEHSKKCPNCPYQIEKNDGCDHMTCIKCRHEFCWACLADFQPIRRHGNHRHDRTCRHYVPNED